MKNTPTAIMVDVESSDNIATSGILSIGAVALDRDKIYDMQFYIPIKFESCLDYSCTFSGDTLDWWRKQSPEAQKVWLDPKGVDLVTGLNAFKNWVFKVCDGNTNNVKLFGNGAAFDNAIMEVLFRKTDIKSPFKFWNNSCYRTIKSAHPKVKMERSGLYHHALDDAISQAEHLIQINKQAGGIYL